MLAAWLLLPVFLGLISLGWGLLLERIGGRPLPGVLLVPAGFAAYIVAARLLTATQPTVGLTTPVVVIVALLGLILGRASLRARRLDPWMVVAAVAVYAMFAAPIVLSGHASFAGYGILGDTSVQFVLVDALMSHHGDPSAFPLSAFSSTVEGYKAAGYPLGTHAGLGAVRPLTGQDVAWVYQPYLAFLMAMLAASLGGLLVRAVSDPRLRALAAFVAAQPALAYSFALQGSIKELATMWLVPLLAAVAAALWDARRTPGARQVLPLAVVAAATVNSVGPAAAVWLGPVFLVVLVVLARQAPVNWRALAAAVVTTAVAVVLLALPVFAPLAGAIDAQSAVLTTQSEVGNLLRPLKLSQVFGVYLNGDYRIAPSGTGLASRAGLTAVLCVIVAVAGVAGIVEAVRRRLGAPLLYVGVSALALAIVLVTGSPWADSKALAIASPAVLLAAAIGVCATAWRRPPWRRFVRPATVVVGAVIGLGVLLSNAFAYHYASLGPRDKFDELSTVGDRLGGKGPTLSTEFEEFTKHFARDARPVGTSEAPIARLQPATLPGAPIRFGYPADLDQVDLAGIEKFRAILLRRSPADSRPPSNYRRTWTGRFYEIWQRIPGPRPARHLPLGQGGTSVARCGQLRRLARTAGDGTLVAAPAPRTTRFSVARQPLPPGWAPRQDDPGLVLTQSGGTIRGAISVPARARYRVWLRGSFGRPITVRVDGVRAGQAKNELAQPAAWLDLGSLPLRKGRHRIELVRGTGSLAPGNGDANRSLGPLVLSPVDRPAGLIRVPAREYETLCGRSFDWVELVPR